MAFSQLRARIMRCVVFFCIALGGTLTHGKPLFAEQPAQTILAVGDSITAGGGGGGGYYRHHLSDLLTTADLSHKFVGPKTDRKRLKHAGYGGWNSGKVQAAFGKIYLETKADIVLLHMGHNHFSDRNPVPTILANTKAILDSAIEANPRVQIYVARVITAGKLPKYSYIPLLNQRLQKLVAEYPAGKNVFLVDQATGFDWKTDTVADKVHPNDSGSKKMAAKWFDAMKQHSFQ